MQIFQTLESEVRSYIRNFPTVFERARGHELVDEDGRAYVDFFAGAGTLNYGHNDPALKRSLLRYIEDDGIIHSLDMASVAKRTFMQRFRDLILAPRGLDYKLMFPGPTGTNAVESALKLARKVTGRTVVYGFDGGFHGMTLGSLAVTSNAMKRGGAGIPLEHAVLLPFDGQERDGLDSIAYLERRLENDAREGRSPAAVLLETVQCEGGVNVATNAWLRDVADLAHQHGALLVVDDIQAGCGRTGQFFSFTEAGVVPDVVCLSKSLSGFGLPMALVLLRPSLDVWKPGEHNGTFRGHNAAFVTAAEALERYWKDSQLQAEVERKGRLVRARLESLAQEHDASSEVRGRGLVQGLVLQPGLASLVAAECFERGLVIETAGHEDEVLKLLPPLTIPDDALRAGLDVIASALSTVLASDASADGARASGAAHALAS